MLEEYFKSVKECQICGISGEDSLLEWDYYEDLQHGVLCQNCIWTKKQIESILEDTDINLSEWLQAYIKAHSRLAE